MRLCFFIFEVPVGIEPTSKGFADLRLTTWLRYHFHSSIEENNTISQLFFQARLLRLKNIAFWGIMGTAFV